jgi:hypothetical protein
LELSRLDSLEEENEDFVAHLTVPSERRGEVWSGGAMVRTAVPEGFLHLVSFRGSEEKEGKVEGLGAWWFACSIDKARRGGEDHAGLPGWKSTRVA